MKEKGFTLKVARSTQYLAETVTNEDYTYDLAVFANTPSQAEILLRSLDQAAMTLVYV